MCARNVTPEQAAIERFWHIGRGSRNPIAERSKLHYNVSPSTTAPILRLDPGSGELELLAARWGFVPHWWKQEVMPRLSFF